MTVGQFSGALAKLHGAMDYLKRSWRKGEAELGR